MISHKFNGLSYLDSTTALKNNDTSNGYLKYSVATNR